jgi:uncharacterized protein
METMKKVSSQENIKRLPLMVMIAMVILSFTNLFGLNIAGASIILGVVFFFINKAFDKQPMTGSGLDIKAIGTNLKDKKIWFWIILPLIIHAISIVISKLFLPEYIEYETTRAGAFVQIELSISSVLQFLVFALGEEIAWRAFFQKQLSKVFSITPVLLSSSLLFSLGHFKMGNPVVVAYGLLIIFINSFLYGVVFHKTKNAWISTISHFVANIFEVIIFVLI